MKSWHLTQTTMPFETVEELMYLEGKAISDSYYVINR